MFCNRNTSDRLAFCGPTLCYHVYDHELCISGSQYTRVEIEIGKLRELNSDNISHHREGFENVDYFLDEGRHNPYHRFQDFERFDYVFHCCKGFVEANSLAHCC